MLQLEAGCSLAVAAVELAVVHMLAELLPLVRVVFSVWVATLAVVLRILPLVPLHLAPK